MSLWGHVPPFTVCNWWFNPFPVPLNPTLCGRCPPTPPCPTEEKTEAQQGTFPSWVTLSPPPRGPGGTYHLPWRVAVVRPRGLVFGEAGQGKAEPGLWVTLKGD